jgi:hypothetical protein
MDMDNQSPKVSAERIAPLVAGLCLAIPTVVFRYPPMVDLPLHEGVVGILRHFDDPAMVPSGLYVHNFGHGNQLFYFLAWLLSYACGVEMACKLVVAATLVAFPLATARLAASIGASRWVALLLTPVAIGWLYLWGMIGNLIGLTALLAALPTLDRLATGPTLRRAGAALAWVLVLYEAHELMLILYAGAALIFAAGQPIRLRETLLRTLPFSAGLALSIGEQVWTARIATSLVSTGTVRWAPIARKLYTIPGALFGGHEPAGLYPLTALSVLAIVLLIVARTRGGTAPEQPAGPALAAGTDGTKCPVPRAALGPRRELIHRYRFELFGAACFALYLVLPANAHGATMVYHRFLAPAYALLVICCGPRGTGAAPARVTLFVMSALPIGALFVLLPLIADVSTAAGNVDILMALVQPGSAVAEIDIGPGSEQLLSSAIGATGARVLAWRGGRLLVSFMVSPISPVVFARGHQWNEPIRRTFYDHYAFCPSYDFTRFRYMLLHTTSERLALGVAVAVAPEATLVETAGDWALFESKLPVVPLLAKDAPLPSPPPDSLRSRLERLSGP